MPVGPREAIMKEQGGWQGWQGTTWVDLWNIHTFLKGPRNTLAWRMGFLYPMRWGFGLLFVATDDWKGIGVGREEGRSAGFHRLNDLIWHSVDNTGLPWWLSGKESICQCRKCRFNPWAGKIPWRRKWQPTPVFWPRKSHEQRSLAGYSPWGHKRVRIPLSD